MHTLCPRIRIMLLVISMMMSMLVWGQGQNSGQVDITATPERICEGGSSTLHAEAIVSSIIDFETGDFSQANFNNTSSYPWVIDQTHPYEGSFCMKSNCYHVDNGISSIEATVNVPNDAVVSFYVRVSSESSYDKFHFYIDNVEQGQPISGVHDYDYKEYSVSAGTHTYKWQYQKDSWLDSNEDCVYVDNISLYREALTITPIIVVDFETHNFSQANFNNTATHPWAITNSSHYEGSYCMKSTCEGINNSESSIQATVVAPQHAKISFWVKVSSEANYDKFHFYIDNIERGNPLSGNLDWTYLSYYLQPGTYTLKWLYSKDYSYHHYNDCVYVDYIVLGEEDVPSGAEDIQFQWDNGMTGPDITVSPTETTTYTVTATDGNGTVIGVAQQTVVVEPFPVVSITTSTGETSICEDDIITLYASVSGTDYIMPGDILCTDESIVHPSDWPNGKTAKAIVFYVDATGQHGWAIDLGEDVPSVKWSTVNQDIPGLQSYANFFEAITDLDGYSNTQKIRSFNNDPLIYPAAWSVEFDQGWYLPSIGQLNILFGAYFAVNAGLEAVGGTTIHVGDLWSSNTNATNKAWMIRISNGQVWTDPKSTKKKVRAVIDF